MGILSDPATLMTLIALKEEGDNGSLPLRNLITEVVNRLAGSTVAGARMLHIVSTLKQEYFVTDLSTSDSLQNMVTITRAGKGALSTVQLFQAALLKAVLHKIDDPYFRAVRRKYGGSLKS